MTRVNAKTHPALICSAFVIAGILAAMSQFGGYSQATSTDLLLGPIAIACAMLIFWAAPQSRILAFLLLLGAVSASPWRGFLVPPNRQYFSLDFNLHLIYVFAVTWLIVALIAVIGSDRPR